MTLNYPGLSDFLANANVPESNDPTLYLDNFLNTISKGIDANSSPRIPRKSNNQDYHLPWINYNYKELCRRKEALHRQTKLYPDNKAVIDDFKRIRNILNQVENGEPTKLFFKSAWKKRQRHIPLLCIISASDLKRKSHVGGFFYGAALKEHWMCTCTLVSTSCHSYDPFELYISTDYHWFSLTEFSLCRGGLASFTPCNKTAINCQGKSSSFAPPMTS